MSEAPEAPRLAVEIVDACLRELEGLEREARQVLEGERAKVVIAEALARAFEHRCPLLMSSDAWVNLARGQVVGACKVLLAREADDPQRVQRKRTKGWRMPPNTVYVGRPSRWGNPFRAGHVSLSFGDCNSDEEALSQFREWLLTMDSLAGQAKQELQGKNLACWCPTDRPCHADVLLEIANP